jgi:pathogenesis-related protein 1
MGNGFQGGGPGMITMPSGGSGGTLGSGGAPGLGGLPGASGAIAMGGVAGFPGAGGTIGAGGFNAAGASSGGVSATGGMFGSGGMNVAGASNGGAGGMSGGDGETGRLVGITAAHNAVRAAVQTTPPLPPLVWSPTLAAYAQAWADSLAQTSCASPHHRTQQELQAKGYGENLAAFSSTRTPASTEDQAVKGWADEKMCYSFGTVAGTERCDMACYARLNSDGCGHYTQIVWRKSTQLGCGVASCKNGLFTMDIWICNFAPGGNYIGQNPY